MVCLYGAVQTPVAAQQGRAALQQGVAAYERAEFQTAVELLSSGLDPAAGPRDSLWGVGIHMLADALIEQGSTSLADVWLQWALRLEPGLSVDSINYPPAVSRAFLAASVIVGAQSFDTATASATWEWSDEAGSASEGSVRVLATPGASIDVRGVGAIPPGGERSLTPGTYVVTAVAPAAFPAEITTDVLPGVTTVIEFDLVASTGYLYVVSRPWGAVLLDGEPIGHTIIAAREVEAGSHRLRIERDGYLPFDTTFTIRVDQRLRLGPIVLRPRTP
jgi:hypothetical protein